MTHNHVHADVEKMSDPQKAKFLQRFFKTGVGEYGFNDLFAGLTVVQSRILAKNYKDLKLGNVSKLLKSEIHEERLIALLILVDQFKKADSEQRKEIFDFYLAHANKVNNWDLVDLSADKIVGAYLLDGVKAWIAKHSPIVIVSKSLSDPIPRNVNYQILRKLAKSQNLWERRIAIIATFAFIKIGYSKITLEIAEILLNDKEDLIQKAVGWMLREVGKRVSIEEEEMFLRKHYKSMPRTMLRYAIEKFPDELRKSYLLGTI